MDLSSISKSTTIAGKAKPGSFFKPTLQAKLSINEPNDIYEQEADAMADKVMRMTDGDLVQAKFFKPSAFPVQRKCAHCEEEEKRMQRKEMNEEEMSASSEMENYVDNLNNNGQPLPSQVRNFYEPRFGADFSQVRIHTDAAAAKSAQSINALAYTSGSNIVFNEQQYSPHTDSGKRLLGHELTHVAQQTGATALSPKSFVQRQNPPGTTTPPTTPPTTTTTPPTTAAPASTVNIAANCTQADIIDIVNQSLTWLDDIYQQLLEYDVDLTFSGIGTPSASFNRIRGALQQAFNTTDQTYAEVIRRRFLHVANVLRTQGRVSVNCDRQFCRGGGSSFTAAFVISPYTLAMCGTGTASSRPIAIFIHEMMHAAIPQVGISNTVTQNTGVSDRAYSSDRVFSFLSPEETLDNADSYAVLAQLLHARANTQIVSPVADTAPSCSNPSLILEAFARASQWNHFALNGLDTDVTLLNGAALNTLNSANLAMLNRAFPAVTNETQLIALRDAFQSLETSGYGNNWGLGCAVATDRNCTNAAVYTYGGKVSSTAVTLNRSINPADILEVCPDWFNLSNDDRIKTIFAAFLIGRPAWITAGFTLSNALVYAEGARVMTNEIIPAPTTTSAREHIESDFRFRNPPNPRVP